MTGVGKKYRLRHQNVPRYTALRDVVGEAVRGVGRRLLGQGPAAPDTKEDFWALRDIGLEVKQGDRLGIIGRNGAGKSTLLKLLSRITAPSQGRILLKGRVGSLLEVGTGFHPELTGRENIFLNGAILGMGRAEILRKFDEIVAFAEIEKFLDTPVKRYSSGMYVRLAFAVAAHLDTEILLVDEVLAVGDNNFQKKCLGKITDISRAGRTVVFVSHNMESVAALTDTCLVLAAGRLVFHGPTRDAIHEYVKSSTSRAAVYTAETSGSAPRITRVEVKTSEPGNLHQHGLPLEVHIELTTPAPLEDGALSFQVFNDLQQAIMYLWTFDAQRPLGRKPGVYHIVCRIPRSRLYLGQYTLTVHFSERFGQRHPQKIEGICPFEVAMYGIHQEFQLNPYVCTYLEDCEWDIRQVAAISG